MLPCSQKAGFTQPRNQTVALIVYHYLLPVYLEAQDSCNTLAFSWISSATDVGLWNIRVSQILCGDPNKRELQEEQKIHTPSQLTLYIL